MYRNPFDGARAKIERSHKHFKELLEAEAVLSKPQTLKIDVEPQSNGDTKVFGTVEHLPKLAEGAIVADILGNLRSSIDIAAHQACIARGQADKKKLDASVFPFGGSEKDWEGNLPRRCPAADETLIRTIRAFKPWKEDGNALLYALSKIAAKDKHVDLVPLANRPDCLEISGISTSNPEIGVTGYQGCVPVWIRDKAELFTILAPAKVEVTGPCILRAKFGFGETYALACEPVIPTLNQMGAMCEQIIDALEAASKLP